jgi:hypothetical protein
VVVSILYERLPSFCILCGVISHKAMKCDMPSVLQKTSYKADDPRKWYLETVGHNGRAHRWTCRDALLSLLTPKVWLFVRQ